MVKRAFGLIGTVVLTIWCLFAAQYFVLGFLGHDWVPERIGQWGDSFGALNALFGSLGFVGLLATLWMQNEQIVSQNKQSKDISDDQHRERFEASFFQLLALMRDLRSNISIGNYSGYAALSYLSSELTASRGGVRISDLPIQDRMKLVNERYEELINNYGGITGPYFRIVYGILKNIDQESKSEGSPVNALYYSRLLRGQLSNDELTLIGVNGMHDKHHKFRRLLIDHKVLKYSSDRIITPILMVRFPEVSFSRRGVD